MRWLTVLVAIFYSVPYLGLQFRASGVLFNVLTDGLVSVEFGMWALSVVVFLYVALGGANAVIEHKGLVLIPAKGEVVSGASYSYLDTTAIDPDTSEFTTIT